MFTGIVEEVGTVVGREAAGKLVRLRVAARRVLADLHLGDSLSHSGVCLTVVEVGEGWCVCEVMQETLRVTTAEDWRAGQRVNLERAVPVGGRFGGHLVQGHVDGVGRVDGIRRDEEWVTFRLAAGEELLRYVVAKGSVAVDGVSLTVSARSDDGFEVALIPHTLEVTTLGERRVGDRVNLETDILAKYVEAALRPRVRGAELTLEWLAEQGFGTNG
ncbi:MAG: riboflavin synthase [Armatimonadetes bacterium]|nr:riboflavin synthase [Armatimonadota bacterium]